MAVPLPQTSARAELALLTRDRILRGLAEVLTSSQDDVTFRAVAEASHVPERTIYRYFDTKEAVFSAFWVWLNERLGVPAPPQSPQQLIDQVPALFAAFESEAPLVRAMLHHRHGRSTRLANTEARRVRLTAALKPLLTQLQPVSRRRLLAGVQVLYSAAGWETMKDYWGLSADQAADAAQWAIGALIAQAQDGARRSSRMAATRHQDFTLKKPIERN
jgi:AcrR family transcriptional regulator